jgi:hypothetical protein
MVMPMKNAILWDVMPWHSITHHKTAFSNPTTDYKQILKCLIFWLCYFHTLTCFYL